MVFWEDQAKNTVRVYVVGSGVRQRARSRARTLELTRCRNPSGKTSFDPWGARHGFVRAGRCPCHGGNHRRLGSVDATGNDMREGHSVMRRP